MAGAGAPGAQASRDDGDKGRSPGRQWIRIAANVVLQLIGDPRWWPRDLRSPGERVLWRTVKRAEADRWPPPDTPKGRIERLRGLAEAQYDETRFWFLVTTELYVVGVGLAGLAFLISPARTWLTFSAAACQVLAAFARIRAVRLHAIAHEADWRALLLDSTGTSPMGMERALLIENLISDGAHRRAGVVGNHYTSGEDPGPQRLIENLRQTAYVTAALYGGAKVQAFFIAAVVIMVPLMGPIIWLITDNALPSEFGVLLITAVLPFWDTLGRQRSWREAAMTLERVVESLRFTNELREVLPLMADAMTATAMAPPIPRTISERWFRDGLGERWELMSRNDEKRVAEAAPVEGTGSS